MSRIYWPYLLGGNAEQFCRNVAVSGSSRVRDRQPKRLGVAFEPAHGWSEDTYAVVCEHLPVYVRAGRVRDGAG